MEFKFKFDEQMVVEAANRTLDEFEYKGKTIRAWADTLTHPKSNADRIRAMTDEELAEWLCDISGWLPMYEGKMHPIMDWLKQEGE